MWHQLFSFYFKIVFQQDEPTRSPEGPKPKRVHLCTKVPLIIAVTRLRDNTFGVGREGKKIETVKRHSPAYTWSDTVVCSQNCAWFIRKAADEDCGLIIGYILIVISNDWLLHNRAAEILTVVYSIYCGRKTFAAILKITPHHSVCRPLNGFSNRA